MSKDPSDKKYSHKNPTPAPSSPILCSKNDLYIAVSVSISCSVQTKWHTQLPWGATCSHLLEQTPLLPLLSPLSSQAPPARHWHYCQHSNNVLQQLPEQATAKGFFILFKPSPARGQCEHRTGSASTDRQCHTNTGTKENRTQQALGKCTAKGALEWTCVPLQFHLWIQATLLYWPVIALHTRVTTAQHNHPQPHWRAHFHMLQGWWGHWRASAVPKMIPLCSTCCPCQGHCPAGDTTQTHLQDSSSDLPQTPGCLKVPEHVCTSLRS